MYVGSECDADEQSRLMAASYSKRLQSNLFAHKCSLKHTHKRK